VEFVLIFWHWQCQCGALFSPLRFKVLLALENLPGHVWSLDIAQEIVGSTCLIFDMAPNSSSASDMSQFLVAAWAIHLDLISSEVGYIIPEPEEPSIVGRLPLFLRASKIVYSKRDTLQFHVLIKIIEIHDFTPA
jgi:hypothetical protein